MKTNNPTPEIKNSFFGNKFPIGLAFLLISLTVIAFYGITLFQAAQVNVLGSILVGLILVGLAIAIYTNISQYHFDVAWKFDIKQAFTSILVHALSALITYFLVQQFKLSAVIASALVGLLGAFLLPKLAVEIFCGSFVGMCSGAVIPKYFELTLAGAIAGLIFYLAKSFFAGFGGKLGTMAFLSVLITCLIYGGKGITPIGDQKIEFSWVVILVAALSTLLTYLLSNYKNLGVVKGASIIGLIGALVLPLLFPDLGKVLPVIAYSASFAGMSSKLRLPTIFPVLVAGLITGIIYLFSFPLYNGVGGKLGTIAFGASLATWGLSQIYENIFRSKNV